LRLDDRGVLAPGKRADLIVFSTSDPDHLPYHAGVEHAEVVISSGHTVRDRQSGTHT